MVSSKWAIYVDGKPFTYSDSFDDLKRLCDELNSALGRKFTVQEWSKIV